MQHYAVFVLPLILVFPDYAFAVKSKSKASSAETFLLQSQGPGKVDTKTLVASLSEVAKGLQTEDGKAAELIKASKSTCKKTALDLKIAVNKGRRSVDMATDDYQKISSQVSALEASKAELEGQIDNSNTELNDLQAKLKKMRTDKGLLKKAAASSLRQVEAVISKSYMRNTDQHHRSSSIEKKVSSLEELSKALSFLQSDSDEDESDSEDSPGPPSDIAPKKDHAPVAILRADKQQVVRASEATQRGFNEEEKKIIDLIETERKKVEDLEDSLQDLQPAISNKLKQAMEINRTLDAANRGIERDSDLMQMNDQKCSTVQKSLTAQRDQRSKVTNDVSMAAKVLEHMDTLLFLSKDLQGLRHISAPSFLQTAENKLDSAAGLSSVLAALSSKKAGLLSLLQEGESAGLEEIVENYGAASSEGPFDSVTKMISGLIASLKAQANEEVNQHQFCQDSLGKNRRDRITKKNSIDTLTSTIRWSKMAIVRLDDDLKYMVGEIKRLTDAQAAETKALKEETKRVEKEYAEHKLADEVITKCVVILNQLCDLGAASASVLQQSNTPDQSLLQKSTQRAKVGSRFDQCKEAAKLLRSASSGVKDLDKITKEYQKAYTDMSGKMNSDAKAAQDARETELKSTKAARAQRASELATAAKDVKEAAKELKLIEDSKKQLEHSCSHVETREEQMARRKEEIDALKEALNVLNGEAIPA